MGLIVITNVPVHVNDLVVCILHSCHYSIASALGTGKHLLSVWAVGCAIFVDSFIVPIHGDVIQWKHFPRYWPFVRGIHRSPVNSAHKGQCRGALMSSLMCALINVWVNNREAGYFRRHRTHYDVTIMLHCFRLLLMQAGYTVEQNSLFNRVKSHCIWWVLLLIV